jgi:RNA polymerase sigma-70 factor (ECF subfamily)
MKRRRRVGEPAHFASIEQGETGQDGERVEIDVEDASKRPDDLALNEWVGGRLRAALLSLPPSYRIIVVLREMEGLSTREVATVTGISEANVKARLHRARVLLRPQLEGL